MKLATLKNNRRDGQLVVVSKDLRRCVAVPEIAATLQSALDDWAQLEPRLHEVYIALNTGTLVDEIPFDSKMPSFSGAPSIKIRKSRRSDRLSLWTSTRVFTFS